MAKRLGANGRRELARKDQPASVAHKPKAKAKTQPKAEGGFKPGYIVVGAALIAGLVFAGLKLAPLANKLAGNGLSSVKNLAGNTLSGIGRKLDFSHNDSRRITGIQVKGISVLDTSDVVKLAGLDSVSVAGDFRSGLVCKKLEASDWVDKADADLDSHAKIVIDIHEKVPLAYTVASNGLVCFTDTKGRMWPISGKRTWDIMLASGLGDTVLAGARHLSAASIERLKSFIGQTAALEKQLGRRVVQADFMRDNEVNIRFESMRTSVSFNQSTMASRFDQLIAIFDRTCSQDSVRTGFSHINLCYGSIAFARIDSSPTVLADAGTNGGH